VLPLLRFSNNPNCSSGAEFLKSGFKNSLIARPAKSPRPSLNARSLRAYLDVLESQTFEQTCQRPARIFFCRFQQTILQRALT
jgi:hypothetical protein